MGRLICPIWFSWNKKNMRERKKHVSCVDVQGNKAIWITILDYDQDYSSSYHQMNIIQEEKVIYCGEIHTNKYISLTLQFWLYCITYLLPSPSPPPPKQIKWVELVNLNQAGGWSYITFASFFNIAFCMNVCYLTGSFFKDEHVVMNHVQRIWQLLERGTQKNRRG